MTSGIRYYILLLLLVVCIPVNSETRDVSPQQLEDVALKTLRPFFNALKSGNVKQIQRYLTGRKLHKTQGPHEPKYQEMLKEYYRDAVFTIERAVFDDDIMVVDVAIDYGSGYNKHTKFYLREEVQNGNAPDFRGNKWMIFAQLTNSAIDQ